jgi:hypothetical protein
VRCSAPGPRPLPHACCLAPGAGAGSQAASTRRAAYRDVCSGRTCRRQRPRPKAPDRGPFSQPRVLCARSPSSILARRTVSLQATRGGDEARLLRQGRCHGLTLGAWQRRLCYCHLRRFCVTAIRPVLGWTASSRPRCSYAILDPRAHLNRKLRFCIIPCLTGPYVVVNTSVSRTGETTHGASSDTE